MRLVKFASPLSLIVFFACQPAVSGPSDAGSGSSSDAASAGSDGSSSTLDAGPGQDRRSSQHDAAGPSDSGQDSLDAMAMDFGGYDIADFDAGMIEYDGGEEPGVVCGENITCDQETEICCAGFNSTCEPADTQCPFLSMAVPCDGPEDCEDNEGGDTCCVTGSAGTYQVSCTEQSACETEGTKVCNSTAECPQGFVCCSAESLQNMGVELGWCKEGGC